MAQLRFQVEIFEDEPEVVLIANPDEGTTLATQPVTVDVLANDTIDGQPVSVGDLNGPPTIVLPPANGATSVSPDTGAVTYTPDVGFCGVDVLHYEISTGDAPDPDCPEVFFDSSTIERSQLEAAVGPVGADNIYFTGADSITYNFVDNGGVFEIQGSDMLPCEGSEEPAFPWEVTLYWGDGGGEVCLRLTNGCA